MGLFVKTNLPIERANSLLVTSSLSLLSSRLAFPCWSHLSLPPLAHQPPRPLLLLVGQSYVRVTQYVCLCTCVRVMLHVWVGHTVWQRHATRMSIIVCARVTESCYTYVAFMGEIHHSGVNEGGHSRYVSFALLLVRRRSWTSHVTCTYTHRYTSHITLARRSPCISLTCSVHPPHVSPCTLMNESFIDACIRHVPNEWDTPCSLVGNCICVRFLTHACMHESRHALNESCPHENESFHMWMRLDVCMYTCVVVCVCT